MYQFLQFYLVPNQAFVSSFSAWIWRKHMRKLLDHFSPDLIYIWHYSMMSNKYFLLQKNDLYNLLVSNAKA